MATSENNSKSKKVAEQTAYYSATKWKKGERKQIGHSIIAYIKQHM